MIVIANDRLRHKKISIIVCWSEIFCLFVLHFLVSQVHENKGVKFITDAAVKEFKGENGKVRNTKFRISNSKIIVIVHFTCFIHFFLDDKLSLFLSPSSETCRTGK